MNWSIIVAGFVAAFTTIGHFAVGSKEFLKPMLNADFEAVPKKVMHCVFHYVSAFLILSAGFLLLAGFGVIKGNPVWAVRFIALNYALFAVWQIALALTSGIPKGIIKLFQWIFFVIIAVFAWVGTV